MRFAKETVDAINKQHGEVISNLGTIGHNFCIEIDEKMHVLANGEKICTVDGIAEIVAKLRVLAQIIEETTGLDLEEY